MANIEFPAASRKLALRQEGLGLPGLDELYVLSIPLLALIATFNGTSLMLAGFKFTGYLWVFAMLFGGVLLAQAGLFNPSQRAFFPVKPWLLWLGWLLLSFSWLEEITYKQVQDAMQVSMPVLVGVAASQIIDSREKLGRLIRVYYYTLLFMALIVAAWFTGLIGEDMDSPICILIRPLAVTIVMIAGLLLAGAKSHPLPAWIGWSVCLMLTVITGSRIASAAILALPIINPINRGLSRRMVMLGVIGVIGAALLSTPIMQERFFRGESGGFSRILEGQIDGSGRFEAWPIVLEKTLERPWLGHGEGSVGALVAQVWEDMVHPHNDYLRVAYELGGIGLLLLISVLLWQLWSLNRWIQRTEGVLQQAFAGAWLGLAAFMIIALVDNPIIYTLHCMNPVFALMGAAYGVAREDERCTEVADLGRTYRQIRTVHGHDSRLVWPGGADS